MRNAREVRGMQETRGEEKRRGSKEIKVIASFSLLPSVDPSRYLWLRNLTSLHTLHLNYSPVVLDECDEWVGALTNLRQLHCLSSSLRPSHLTKLVQLRSLRTLYVDSFTDRFELRQRAKELVPNLYIREMN